MNGLDHRKRESQSATNRIKSIRITEDWRRYGKVRRNILLEQDEVEGGTIFSINKKLHVSSYFDVAERVSRCSIPMEISVLTYCKMQFVL